MPYPRNWRCHRTCVAPSLYRLLSLGRRTLLARALPAERMRLQTVGGVFASHVMCGDAAGGEAWQKEATTFTFAQSATRHSSQFSACVSLISLTYQTCVACIAENARGILDISSSAVLACVSLCLAYLLLPLAYPIFSSAYLFVKPYSTGVFNSGARVVRWRTRLWGYRCLLVRRRGAGGRADGGAGVCAGGVVGITALPTDMVFCMAWPSPPASPKHRPKAWRYLPPLPGRHCRTAPALSPLPFFMLLRVLQVRYFCTTPPLLGLRRGAPVHYSTVRRAGSRPGGSYNIAGRRLLYAAYCLCLLACVSLRAAVWLPMLYSVVSENGGLACIHLPSSSCCATTWRRTLFWYPPSLPLAGAARSACRASHAISGAWHLLSLAFWQERE